MKILLVCSKKFYNKILRTKKEPKERGHIITLPNCHDDLKTEARYREKKEHAEWKGNIADKIKNRGAVLVLNFEKNGIKNYIGGALFWRCIMLLKWVGTFLYNDIPEGVLKDEIVGFNPYVINGDLDKVK